LTGSAGAPVALLAPVSDTSNEGSRVDPGSTGYPAVSSEDKYIYGGREHPPCTLLNTTCGYWVQSTPYRWMSGIMLCYGSVSLRCSNWSLLLLMGWDKRPAKVGKYMPCTPYVGSSASTANFRATRVLMQHGSFVGRIWQLWRVNVRSTSRLHAKDVR
jgi:hypothetical protein